jgi:transglutaminase-like putative cysteine protease
MAAQQQSPFVAVSRAGLTLAAALGLARVLAGGSWLGAMVVAAVVPALIFAYAHHRRWHPLTAPAVSVVIGAWLAVIVDDPSETLAGVPSAAALSHFGHDLSRAPDTLRSATVPVNAVGAALLLSFIAVFVASAATEIIARRLDAPIGAIGPSIALYIAIAALGSGRWAPTTACYALVVVAYFVALQYAEVTARRTWFQAGHSRRSQAATGGIAAGAMVIAFAIAIGPAFPGARGGAWINYRKLGNGTGSSVLSTPSPLLTLSSKLNRDKNKEMFIVKTSNDTAYYWRLVALDDLGSDGNWGYQRNHGDQRSARSLLPPRTVDPRNHVTQTIQMTGPDDPYWLPAAYRPFQISLPDSAVLPASTSLILTNRTLQGLTYTVTSDVWQPTDDQLSAVKFPDLAAKSDQATVPGNFPKEIRDTAETLTRDAASPYGKAVALEKWFQSDLFTYDQTVDYGGSPRALQDFVLKNRRGFCEQFALAFAEMARAVHLPTRVAVGYHQSALDSTDHKFHVMGDDAHAWPEVWLGPKIGWYAFEPTKNQFNPTTQRGSENRTPTTTPGATTPTSTASNATTVPRTGSTTPPLGDKRIQVAPPATKSTGGNTGSRVLLALIAAAGAVVLVVVGGMTALVVAALRRTRRRRYAVDARRRVLGAWTEALERLAAAGVQPRPAATSIEFALRHAPAHGAGGAGPPLMDLARLHTAAMFAPDSPSEADADAAWKHVDAIDAALRDNVTRSERWVTRLRLRRRDRPVRPDRRNRGVAGAGASG